MMRVSRVAVQQNHCILIRLIISILRLQLIKTHLNNFKKVLSEGMSNNKKISAALDEIKIDFFKFSDD